MSAFGFGDVDVTQKRDTGRHAARGRIRHHRHVRQSRLAEFGERGAGLGHLKQREQPFLHPCPSAGRETDQRPRVLDAILYRPTKALADDRTHRTAHELKLEGYRDDGYRLDRACHDHQGIPLPGLFLRLRQAIPIPLAVPESQGILRLQLARDLVSGVRVEKHVQRSRAPILMWCSHLGQTRRLRFSSAR